jgi:hypothetical protein
MHPLCLVVSLFVGSFAGLSGPVVAQCLTRPSVNSFGSGATTRVSPQGFMFDVQNTSGTEIRITGLEQTIDLFGTYDFEIYTRSGSYDGFESTPSAWTLAGQVLGVTVALTSSVVPIPIPLSLTIPPYATQGFYVTNRGSATQRLAGWSGGLNGARGLTTATDGVINVVCGVGKFYPFTYTLNQQVRGGGGFSSPGRHYCWSGRVIYCQVPGFAASNTVLGAGCGGASPPVLTATSLPRLDSNWNRTLTNVPPTAVLGVTILGFSDPGLNDLTFLGLPGCGLRASLDAVTVFAVTGPTHIASTYLPNTSTLVGTSLYTSAALFQNPPVNPFGAITANGIQGAIGYQ